MKSSRSACLLCRHLAANSRRAGSRAEKWEAQVTQFSTTAVSQSDDPTITSTAPTPDGSSIHANPMADRNRNKSRHERPPFRKLAINQPRGDPRIIFSQRKPAKDSAKDSAKVDALFEQIVREQTEKRDAPAVASPTNAGINLALIKAVEKLEHMIEKNEPEADMYGFLKSEIYPMLQEPGTTRPKVFYQVVFRLMEKVFAAKKAAIRSPKLPTIADIFRVYADISEMIPQWWSMPQRWAMLVGELMGSIVEMDPLTEQQAPAATEGKLVSRDGMLVELVDAWKVLSLPKNVPIPDDEVTDGFWFPRPDKYSLKKFSNNENFPAAFSSLFPHHYPSQLGAPAAVLAIATYALLLDPQRSNAEVRQSATRFVAKVAYLITFVNIRDTALERQVSKNFPRLESYVMSRWPDIKKQLRDKVESMAASAGYAQPNQSTLFVNGARVNANVLGTSLGQAYVTNNINEVDRLWKSFVGSEDDIPPETSAELRKYPELFDSFINVRMALNQPDKAIAALNTLRKVGLKPTMKTWNVMLDGCKKARNLNGIKNVWAKLASSGMKLDVRIWTTRISGLIESGDAEGGIKALQEMTKLWNESSKDENATAVKPTIEPVNAALVGLIRQDQVSVAEHLLLWAGRQGIEPDTFTFNTLLQRFVRDGRDAGVRRLFNIMEKTGVRADEATFTIILDAAFSKVAHHNSEEQVKTVTAVLDNMKAVGLEANLQNYGKMIYLLLRSGDGAKDAIKLVLAHLWKQGHELSPHIYTMLVEHYFSRQPPDLDAVDSLLERRKLLDFDDIDAIFYDRLIKGYTLAGQPSKALKIYYRLSKAGVTVILSTQLELLRALIGGGLVDDARGLVANTKRMFEESHRSYNEVEGAGFWGHPFWRLASQNGLLDREGTATPTTEQASP